ncbi:hypothetical protein SDC9_170643 [bioreactor metagenome]|uniref:Uncharacterized protein n=1 Tax=bioreactor metagenome TaxID=1076179 RepID=A0A645G9D4_9ZZZZ
MYIFVQRHIDAGGVRRSGVFAHHANGKAEPRFLIVKQQSHGKKQREVHKQALGEQHRSQKRNLGKTRDTARPQGGGDGAVHDLAGIRLAQKIGKARAKNRERKARHGLVPHEGHGDHGIDQRAQSAPRRRHENGRRRAVAEKPRLKAEKRAQHHHALDAKVQVSRFFAQDASQSGQQKRRAKLHGHLKKQSRFVHSAASFRLRARTTR